MKKIVLVLILLLIATPLLAATGSIDILQPNDDGRYEMCDGTYERVHPKTGVRTYYIQGVLQKDDVLIYDEGILISGKSAKTKRDEADAIRVAAYVSPEDARKALEVEVALLRAELDELKVRTP